MKKPEPEAAAAAESKPLAPAKDEAAAEDSEPDDDNDGGLDLDLLDMIAGPAAKKARKDKAADSKAANRPDAASAASDAASSSHRAPSDSGPAAGSKPAAARAKAASARSDMPPPLTKTATAKRKSSGKAAASADDLAKEEQALRKMISQAMATLREFEGWDREVLVHEKDKRWYKQIKFQSDAINTKRQRVLDEEIAEEATIIHKKLGVMVWAVKSYTAWVKRGDDSAYNTELANMYEWCEKDPLVVMDLPTCMKSDAMELKFRGGIAQLLDLRAGQ